MADRNSCMARLALGMHASHSAFPYGYEVSGTTPGQLAASPVAASSSGRHLYHTATHARSRAALTAARGTRFLRSVEGTSFPAGMPRLLSAAAFSALHASLISDSVSFSSCCTSVTRLTASASLPARRTVALTNSGSALHLEMAWLLTWPSTSFGCLRMLSIVCTTGPDGQRPTYHSCKGAGSNAD
jgi:hypothetical protein